MSKYYIVLDSITKDNLLTFSLYRLDIEKSIRPQLTSVEKVETIDRLISIIEDLVANYGIEDVCIFGDRKFMMYLYDKDNPIRNYIRVMFRKNSGYRVIYIPFTNDEESKVIELLDTSASGLLRYLRKIKFYL